MDIAKGDHDIGLSPSSALPAGTSREGPQDDSTAFLGGADLESVTAAGSSADRGLIELSRGGQIEELVIPMGTTHLILAGCQEPVELGWTLTRSLPTLTHALVVLDVSSCHLSCIPDTISICSHLQELNISNNHLAGGTLPSFLIFLRSLRVLLADNCNIGNLARSLAPLQSLHTLALRANKLRSLPSWLCYLSRALDTLLVDGNPLFGPYADLVHPLLPRTAVRHDPETLQHHSAASTQVAQQEEVDVVSLAIGNDEEGVASSLYSKECFPEASGPSAPALGFPWSAVAAQHLLPSDGNRPRWAGSRKLSGTTTATHSSNGSSRVNSLLLSSDSESQWSANDLANLDAGSGSGSALGSARLPDNLEARVNSSLSMTDTLPHTPLGQSFPSDGPGSGSQPFSAFDGGPTPKVSTLGVSSQKYVRGDPTRMTASEFFQSEASGSRFGQGGFEDHHASHPDEGNASNRPGYVRPQRRTSMTKRSEYESSEGGDLEEGDESAVEGESEAEGGDNRDSLAQRARRLRKPSFLKKISMVADRLGSRMDRKRSLAKLRTPEAPADPTTYAPLHNTSLADGGVRLSQLTVTAQQDSSTRLPAHHAEHTQQPPPLNQANSPGRFQISRHDPSAGPTKSTNDSRPPVPPRHPNRPRVRKTSRAVPQAHQNKIRSQPSTMERASRRESFLLLNSFLPPLVSPGPLRLSFSQTSPQDADATQRLNSRVEDDATMVHSRLGSSSSTAADEQQDGLAAAPQVFLEYPSVEESRMALRPIMAYLRDVEELSQEDDLQQLSEREGDSAASSVRSRSVSRKPSLAAISSASSNRYDRSSGYESTAMTSPSTSQATPKLKDDVTKRERLVAEIISSERSYLRGLEELVTLYIQPASAPHRASVGNSVNSSSVGGGIPSETVIPLSERRTVFSVVETIAQFHTTVFLPELESAAIHIPEQRASVHTLDGPYVRQAAQDVAKVFIRHAAYLKLYHSYCVNFDSALSRLALWKTFTSNGYQGLSTQLPASPMDSPGKQNAATALTSSQKKRIRHVLRSAKKDSRHSQIDLSSYLLLPIQRIPRYRMLLESLAYCTPDSWNPSEPDATVANALELVSQLATEMNEKKRESEGRQRLLYWHNLLGSSFRSPLVQPHRILLKEGSMQLTRVVKRVSHIVPEVITQERTPQLVSASQIHSLVVDDNRKQLFYLLCNDVLVLMQTSQPADAGQMELWTVIRLGRVIGGREEPASIFGSADMLRLVDGRAILYLTCETSAQARECCDLINQQGRLNAYPTFLT